MLVYVIAASVVLYFIYLFAFAGLSRKERARLLVCFILLVSAAFFWSAFEQKPTSFNLFANDYTNRMIGSFEIPAVWFQSINACLLFCWRRYSAGHGRRWRVWRPSEQYHQIRHRHSAPRRALA
jgi:dipeptide/tripeptide permease